MGADRGEGRDANQGHGGQERSQDVAGLLLRAPLHADPHQQLDIVGRLIRCENVRDMKRQMTDILDEVCRYIQQNRKPRKDHFVRNVIEFIEANYQDANLSVSSIAEHFQLAPTYPIKLFREQTGEGVFRYVTRIRMDRATKLLADKGFSIHEVARKVGYYSATAFIRAFKKCEGVTPGSFKELE